MEIIISYCFYICVSFWKFIKAIKTSFISNLRNDFMSRSYSLNSKFHIYDSIFYNKRGNKASSAGGNKQIKSITITLFIGS